MGWTAEQLAMHTGELIKDAGLLDDAGRAFLDAAAHVSGISPDSAMSREGGLGIGDHGPAAQFRAVIAVLDANASSVGQDLVDVGFILQQMVRDVSGVDEAAESGLKDIASRLEGCHR
ncbi:hypothetical protein [Nocardioides sp.]|uniref:hypothetical protein n=1 Tax=Nocardioides sp. TaxID=35761 RepID=UPI002715CC6F|nr:hypothetical protein [Nocardioides sp.]MDO9456109.1 hypothetical protein [Nocardioides sp.]